MISPDNSPMPWEPPINSEVTDAMIEAGVTAAEQQFWEDVSSHDVRAIYLAMRTADNKDAGDGLASVWEQARDNHRQHSDTGDRESDIRFLTLGLTGEAGEVANFVKKRWRDGDDYDEAIQFEIADVCAYAFMLADTMGMTPNSLIGTIAHKQQVFITKMKARPAPPRADQSNGGE